MEATGKVRRSSRLDRKEETAGEINSSIICG